MDHVVLKKGVYWVRMVVPPDLVKIIGKKNLMESLRTKDKTIAKAKKHAVIVRFQDQLLQACNLLEPRVAVPIAPLVQEIVPHVITRGGFGRRFVLQREADAILAELEAASQIPIIKEPSPEIRALIQRARQVPEHPGTTTVTADPVPFDRMVSAWASENHQPSHELTLMLSKASRFIAWLRSDRNDRAVPDLPEDMRLVTHAEFVRYKEYLLSTRRDHAASRPSKNRPPVSATPVCAAISVICEPYSITQQKITALPTRPTR